MAQPIAEHHEGFMKGIFYFLLGQFYIVSNFVFSFCTSVTALYRIEKIRYSDILKLQLHHVELANRSLWSVFLPLGVIFCESSNILFVSIIRTSPHAVAVGTFDNESGLKMTCLCTWTISMLSKVKCYLVNTKAVTTIIFRN